MLNAANRSTVAYYQNLNKTSYKNFKDIPNIAINNATRVENSFTIQDGQQKSKGYEVEIVANPVAGLNIVAGYAKNENKVVKAAAFEGNYVAQHAPRFASTIGPGLPVTRFIISWFRGKKNVAA